MQDSRDSKFVSTSYTLELESGIDLSIATSVQVVYQKVSGITGAFSAIVSDYTKAVKLVD